MLQLFGQLKRRRHRHFAEICLLRLLDGDRQVDPVPSLDVMVKGFLNPLFQLMKHELPSITRGLEMAFRSGGESCLDFVLGRLARQFA